MTEAFARTKTFLVLLIPMLLLLLLMGSCAVFRGRDCNCPAYSYRDGGSGKGGGLNVTNHDPINSNAKTAR